MTNTEIVIISNRYNIKLFVSAKYDEIDSDQYFCIDPFTILKGSGHSYTYISITYIYIDDKQQIILRESDQSSLKKELSYKGIIYYPGDKTLHNWSFYYNMLQHYDKFINYDTLINDDIPYITTITPYISTITPIIKKTINGGRKKYLKTKIKKYKIKKTKRRHYKCIK
jgi:hypothetical protein